MAAKQVGAKPTCLCTQVKCLDDLPKNKVNSQQNLSRYKVWKPECAEDALKWAVRRFYQPSGKVPGPATGTLENWVSDISLVAPSPPRAGKSQTHARRDLDAKSYWGRGKKGSK